jgi:hypothetical protein
MAGKYGVEETKDLFELGFAVALAVKAANADGKINLFDLPQAIPLLSKVSAAVEDFSQVPSELGEIDEADAKALLDYAKSHLPEVTSDDELRHKLYVYVKLGLCLAEAVTVTNA